MKQNTKYFLKSIANNKFTISLLERYNEKKESKYRKSLYERLGKKERILGNVCIVLDKGMGDFLLFAYYFEKLVEYYNSIGKNVYVLCNNYNVEFLSFCHCKISNIIAIDANEKDVFIYEDLVNKYSYFFEIMILPFDSISKYYCNLIHQLAPGQIYSEGITISNPRKLSLSDKKLLKRISVFRGTDKGFYASRHKILTEKLIDETINLGIIRLNKGEPVLTYKYYVINIGSSTPTKVWPIKNVITLIKMIKDKREEKPVILGNATREVIHMLEESGADCSFINLMDIRKTISICGNAEFVVTNDTGLYHISVCLGIPTYVISAGSYIEHFIPYPEQLAKQNIGYILPDTKCENCKRHLICFFQRKKNKTLECLKGITPQAVFDYLQDEFNPDRNEKDENIS